MSSADLIWALVSELPPAERERRRLMVLQVAADDSGSEPQEPVFVLAGFVAQSTVWANFSIAWDAALKLPPRLDYFKMAEAYSLRGEFDPSRGWDETKRDTRLKSLVEIIGAHLLPVASAKLTFTIIPADVEIQYDHQSRCQTQHGAQILRQRFETSCR